MKFHPAPIDGAFTIEQEPRGDDRGFFARWFCAEEFAAAGLVSSFVQANDSYSVGEGTLRGMHYQLPPAAEVKVVRVVRGAVFDVVLDLRPHSPTFGQSFGRELSADNRLMMYVPRGCAHGFLTLEPNSEAFYLVGAPYTPEHERGVRWNDPRFNLPWPREPSEVSAKDASWPDFDPAFHGLDRLWSV